MYKLSEADSLAIDQFLETRNAAPDGGSPDPQGQVSEERLAMAAKLFDLVDGMPTFEPSADLGERTLRFIDRSERRRQRDTNATEIDATQQIRPAL